MTFEKATITDTEALTDLRIAYLQEDLGPISDEDLKIIKNSLPSYYSKHLQNDLEVYVCRVDGDIVACTFLLIVEKPMSPSFITGKTGTVLNVYTKPQHRHKGLARQLMTMMLEDATKMKISVIELKSTEDGYPLYQSVGFEDSPAHYHNMRYILN